MLLSHINSVKDLTQSAKFQDVKKILLRLDLNVPVVDGRVSDTTRIDRSLPTLQYLLQQKPDIKLFLCSHFGRPKNGYEAKYSLLPLVDILQDRLNEKVQFVDDINKIQQYLSCSDDEIRIYLLENTRFYPGEEANDPDFAKMLAKAGDVYVNDAFSASHRSHASIAGVTDLLPSYAGLSLMGELEALVKAVENPSRPLTAIVGGAKISSKIDLLYNLLEKVDNLVIAGGMANGFLQNAGINIGKSLIEPGSAEKACEICAKAKAYGCNLIYPIDVVVAKEFSNDSPALERELNDIADDEMILDAGQQTVAKINDTLRLSKTLLWNGPLGAFEMPNFAKATIAVAQQAADLVQKGKLLAIAGGGDTVSAMAVAGVIDKLSYVSTAGGAFLEWIEGKNLPGIEALEQNKKRFNL